MFANRILSGMRPTGSLHLGHYHGVLKNWIQMQHEYECLFFVADWHALTTHYESPQIIEQSVWDMVVDWLAAGVDPANATLFMPQHLLCFTTRLQMEIGPIKDIGKVVCGAILHQLPPELAMAFQVYLLLV